MGYRENNEQMKLDFLRNLNSRQLAAIGVVGFFVLLLAVSVFRSSTQREGEGDTAPYKKSKESNRTVSTDNKPDEIEEREVSEFGSAADSGDVYIPSGNPSKETAMAARANLKDKLPIGFSNKSSNGITTSTAIFILPSDDRNIVRLEIVGINYQNIDPNPSTNPQVTAFIETFKLALQKISEAGVDPKELHYLFGTRDYIQTTTQRWITQYGLL